MCQFHPKAYQRKRARSTYDRALGGEECSRYYCCGFEEGLEPVLLFFDLPALQVSETISTLLTANVLSLLLDALIPAELLEAAVLESVELDAEALEPPFSQV